MWFTHIGDVNCRVGAVLRATIGRSTATQRRLGTCGGSRGRAQRRAGGSRSFIRAAQAGRARRRVDMRASQLGPRAGPASEAPLDPHAVGPHVQPALSAAEHGERLSRRGTDAGGSGRKISARCRRDVREVDATAYMQAGRDGRTGHRTPLTRCGWPVGAEWQSIAGNVLRAVQGCASRRWITFQEDGMCHQRSVGRHLNGAAFDWGPATSTPRESMPEIAQRRGPREDVGGGPGSLILWSREALSPALTRTSDRIGQQLASSCRPDVPDVIDHFPSVPRTCPAEAGGAIKRLCSPAAPGRARASLADPRRSTAWSSGVSSRMITS